MRTVELDESRTGAVDATGQCVVQLGPRPRQTWSVNNVAVSSTSTATPEARVYLGDASNPQGYLAGTYNGVFDNAAASIKRQPGQYVTAVFAGATPGATCTLTLYGEMTVPG